jgi:hypothetical protein
LALKHAKPMLKTAYLQPIRGSLKKTIGDRSLLTQKITNSMLKTEQILACVSIPNFSRILMLLEVYNQRNRAQSNDR